jgi:hypothetical protein
MSAGPEGEVTSGARLALVYTLYHSDAAAPLCSQSLLDPLHSAASLHPFHAESPYQSAAARGLVVPSPAPPLPTDTNVAAQIAAAVREWDLESPRLYHFCKVRPSQ